MQAFRENLSKFLYQKTKNILFRRASEAGVLANGICRKWSEKYASFYVVLGGE